TRLRFFFFSSRRRHTRWPRDWSSDVCSSDLAMRFADLLEAKHAGRLGLEPARRHLLRNFLQRHVGQREARRAEHKTTEEREVDTTRHLQQRVEVLDRREPPQPTREAPTAASAQHGKGI